MSNIVLKDSTGADVVFQYTGSPAANKQVYQRRGSTLLDTYKLELSLTESANTNRVRYKLSVPKVCSKSAECNPVVSFTQVASGDITVVKFSELTDRKLLQALTASLVATTAMSDLVENGYFPN